MSRRDDRRLEGQRRKQRRELTALFQQGAALVATTDSRGQAGVGQLVSLSRATDGSSLVRVVHFDPADWDNTLDESEHNLPDLNDALEWIERESGVHWWDFHGPD